VDLFAIIGALRRHWLVTVVVTALTIGVMAVLVFVVPRSYEAKASYILVNPPPAPTDTQIAADPSLAEINRNNPYLRFVNQATMGEVLASRVSGSSVRSSLVQQGADGDYTVAPSSDFGGSGLLLDLTGTGQSPQEAKTTLTLVTDRMKDELYAIQKVYGADDAILITALPVAEPTDAVLVVSGLARSLVGATAAGVVVLFTAISIAEARAAVRRPGGAARRAVTDEASAAGAGPEPEATERPTSAVGSSARSGGRRSRHAEDSVLEEARPHADDAPDEDRMEPSRHVSVSNHSA
jgi:capsular polysaccharide biosynthesis protein